jgi:hypothetical protein
MANIGRIVFRSQGRIARRGPAASSGLAPAAHCAPPSIEPVAAAAVHRRPVRMAGLATARQACVATGAIAKLAATFQGQPPTAAHSRFLISRCDEY